MRAFIKNFILDQRGVTSIEYGLIAMAISLAIAATYFLMGDAISGIMGTVSSGLAEATSNFENN